MLIFSLQAPPYSETTECTRRLPKFENMDIYIHFENVSKPQTGAEDRD
jgi:hypothetical protein